MTEKTHPLVPGMKRMQRERDFRRITGDSAFIRRTTQLDAAKAIAGLSYGDFVAFAKRAQVNPDILHKAVEDTLKEKTQ